MPVNLAVGNYVKPCLGFISCFSTTLNSFLLFDCFKDWGRIDGFVVLEVGCIQKYINNCYKIFDSYMNNVWGTFFSEKIYVKRVCFLNFSFSYKLLLQKNGRAKRRAVNTAKE